MLFHFGQPPGRPSKKYTPFVPIHGWSVLEIWVVFNMFYLSSPAWFICSDRFLLWSKVGMYL